MYTPHPDSLRPLRRCYRVECRTVKPEGRIMERCPRCNALIDNHTPLVRWLIYVESC